jgi:hypothetical protein
MSPLFGVLFTLALLYAAIKGFRNAVRARRRIKAAVLVVVIILLVATIVTGGYVGFGLGFGVNSQPGSG